MNIHAYILAGGKSTRMGEEKGLMMFQDKPLIHYVIEAVQEVTKEIFIVTTNKAYTQFGFPLIADLKKDLGPAGAIDTVLSHSTAAHNLIIACDMPFIDGASIRHLIDQHHAEITVPLFNQYPEALFGIYESSIKHGWHQQVDQGLLKLSDLLSCFETNFVDGNNMSESNSKLFRNMNSKDDLLDT